MPSSTPEVIELLETYLEEAKTNRFSHVAITMVGYPNIAACDYAGDTVLQRGQLEAMGKLAATLQADIANVTPPEPDPSLSASYVCFDLRGGPIGFDFLVWLIDQEMTRIREGAPAPLRVGFWKGRNGRLPSHNQAWLDKVFRPCLRFLSAVEDDAALLGRGKRVYVPRGIVAAARAGERVPTLRTETKSPHPGAVTITLREAEHDPERNSNVGAWLNFARDLKKQGENVVFVRDTDKAYEPLQGAVTCPKASRDLDARMALYQEAKANLFVSNGPVGLALFGDRPWLQFNDPSKETTFSWTDGWGMEPGDQFPWSNQAQRLILKSDSYDNIAAAWDDLRAALV